MILMKNEKGFTFVELVVIIGLISLLSAVGIVNLLASRRSVEVNVCANNRAVIEHAENQYYLYKHEHSQSLDDLFASGYISKLPECPSGGTYAWVPYDSNDPRYQTVLGCSYHSGEESTETSTEDEVVVEDEVVIEDEVVDDASTAPGNSGDHRNDVNNNRPSQKF